MEPRCPRYSSLDMWRGVACLLVIIFHSTFYIATPQNASHWKDSVGNALAAICARLWMGVPMFFVISGYCICAAADSTILKGSSTATYFWRRFRRIYPPYWIFFAMSVVYVGVIDYAIWPRLFSDHNHGIDRPWRMNLQTFVGYMTLTGTWLARFIRGTYIYQFMGHAWTLYYEEQFYAVVGIALLVTRKRFFVFIAIVSSVVLCINVSHVFFHTDSFSGFFFDGKWLHFALGVLVYYEANYSSRIESRYLKGTVLAGVCYALFVLGGLRSFHRTPGQEMLVASSFAAILIAARPLDGRISSSAVTRALTWCGTICYSLYLVHWPIVKGISHGLYLTGVTSIEGTLFITVPLCMMASLILGWAFHVYVERRFLNSK